jgi:hypothetical protein
MMQSKSTKFFLLLTLLGGVIWIGGGVARMVVGYSVFVPGTLEWNTLQSEAARLQSIWLYTLLGGWTGWASAAAVVGGIASMINLRGSFRRHGWLVMSSVLFVLVIPIQGFIVSEDYRLWTFFETGSGMPLAPARDIFFVFMSRFTNPIVNVLVAMSTLSLVTIVALGALQPLSHSKSKETA